MLSFRASFCSANAEGVAAPLGRESKSSKPTSWCIVKESGMKKGIQSSFPVDTTVKVSISHQPMLSTG